MISSWEGNIHKNLLKTNDLLEQELGNLEKEDVSHDGIICGPLCKPHILEEREEVLELSIVLKNKNLPSIKFLLSWNLSSFLLTCNMPI